MGTSLLIFLGIIVILAIVAVTTYNGLITLKTRVREAASDIDVQLKRRYDLIPNLVESVKGSKNFEQETLEKVIQARNQAVSISGLSSEKADAENQLSGALRQLFALSENYPDLKSNQNFLALQTELTNTEDRVLAARRFYNQVVTDYNAQQDQFPALLFKGLAGAKPELFFELENPTEERKNPQVKF
ncbi:MAG: LemA family protein [candidate division SR1 bacterium]|nr:LemA family protein [candidate division SR1 bacterium]